MSHRKEPGLILNDEDDDSAMTMGKQEKKCANALVRETPSQIMVATGRLFSPPVPGDQQTIVGLGVAKGGRAPGWPVQAPGTALSSRAKHFSGSRFLRPPCVLSLAAHSSLLLAPV